jgi:hypothetical protein
MPALHLLRTRTPRWALAAWLGLAVVAAALRFAGLTAMPPTLWVDEAWFDLKAADVLRGQTFIPIEPTNRLGVGLSPVHVYATAAVQAAGVPAAWAARFASAVAGLLTVLVVFPAALTLLAPLYPEPWRSLGALVATWVLGTLFASLYYSRDGGQNAACVLFAVPAAVGTFLAFERLRWAWAWAAAAGIGLGMALATYEAALALPILLAAYGGLRLWRMPVPQRWRGLGLLIVIGAAALVVVAPFLLVLLREPDLFFRHLRDTQAVQGPGPLPAVLRPVQGLAAVVLGLSVRGDLLPGRNLAGRPLFDVFSSALLWLGLAVLWLRHRRRPSAQLLLLWVAVMALPSALSDAPPAFPRMLPMTPALAISAGVGAVAGLQWAGRRGPAARWLAAAVLGLGLAAGGVTSAWDYFVRWPRDPRVFDARSMGPRQTADRARELARAGPVLLTTRSDPFVEGPFTLLLGGTGVTVFDAAPGCFPLADRAPWPATYGVIQVLDQATLPLLRQAYPAGREVGYVMHPAGYAYAVFFQVPAGTPAPAPTHAVNVAFEGGVSLAGYSWLAEPRLGQTATIQLYWQAAQRPNEPLTGFVHVGQGRQSQPLIGQHDGPLCPSLLAPAWQPGFAYVETRSFLVDGPPGEYDVRVGVYRTASAQRLAIQSASVSFEDSRAILTALSLR